MLDPIHLIVSVNRMDSLVPLKKPDFELLNSQDDRKDAMMLIKDRFEMLSMVVGSALPAQ